ncbi:MAG: pilus assembly protein TadD, partial [Mesorhizobium sp.]|nr:pilus assembly protein TadD [Mesorhizobium sp.]
MPTTALNLAAKRLITTAFMAALAASVAGCGSTSKFTTGSISRSDSKPLETMSAGDLHTATSRLGQSYARNPNDKRLAINFAAALQMDGDADQSLAVMRKLAIAYPKDRDVLAAYGKALAANG